MTTESQDHTSYSFTILLPVVSELETPSSVKTIIFSFSTWLIKTTGLGVYPLPSRKVKVHPTTLHKLHLLKLIITILNDQTVFQTQTLASKIATLGKMPHTHLKSCLSQSSDNTLPYILLLVPKPNSHVSYTSSMLIRPSH